MQPDSLRGTPLEKYTGLDADSVCACSHTFGRHALWDPARQAIMRCTLCTCIAFTSVEAGELMASAAIKAAEQNGADLGRKYAAVFTVRQEATYQAKVELGMYFAGREGLSLENGAAFVTGFVVGIDSGGKRTAAALSLEEKIDFLLNRELDKRLGNGDDSGGNAGTPAPSV